MSENQNSEMLRHGITMAEAVIDSRIDPRMVRPVNDSVAVRPLQSEHVIAGIIVPGDMIEQHAGVVLALGPRFAVPLHDRSPDAAPLPEVAVGDVVIYRQRAGQVINEHDPRARFLLMRAGDLLAVLREPSVESAAGGEPDG